MNECLKTPQHENRSAIGCEGVREIIPVFHLLIKTTATAELVR